MSTLRAKRCVPCLGGVPPLTRSEAEQFYKDIPEWTLAADNHDIRRRYTFADFAHALAFVNAVGALAEEEGHHPDITFGWGYAEVLLYSHKINGLHENDFIMAAKVEDIFNGVVRVTLRDSLM